MAEQWDVAFRWTVKNFDMFHSLHEGAITSPQFSVGPFNFNLVLCSHDKENIGLFLCRIRDCGATVDLVKFELCIIDEKEIPQNALKYECSLKSNSARGWCPFLIKDKLFNTARDKLAPKPKNLTIECKVLLPSKSESSGNDLACDEQDSEIIFRDFQELLKNGIHSDMTLHADDNEFKVHRAILECRCPELIEYLEPAESPSEYALQDLKAPILRTLLEYIYKGTFEDNNICKELLTASETYILPDLRNALSDLFPKSISAMTEVDVSRVSFQWIISEFSKLQIGQELAYPAFCDSKRDWDELKIILTVFQTENGMKSLEMKFQRMCLTVDIFIKCKVSIHKTDYPRNMIYTNEYEHLFKKENWITPFGSEVKLSDAIFQDTLELSFEISITDKDEINKTQEVLSAPKTQKVGVNGVRQLHELQRDLRNLYRVPKFTDTILCVGDEKFPAHKAILCARSPVFAKMFTYEEDEITIKEMDASTFSSMLQYIYCGCMDELNVPETIELYGAAAQYEVLSLVEKCSTRLKSSINAENIGEILLLADAHHDDSLKRCVYDYMACNPGQLLSSNSLTILKNRLDVYPDIVNGLLNCFLSLKK